MQFLDKNNKRHRLITKSIIGDPRKYSIYIEREKDMKDPNLTTEWKR